MSIEIMFYIYLYGWIVYSFALVDDVGARDIAVSFVVGLIWPIHLPANLLRVILNFNTHSQ